TLSARGGRPQATPRRRFGDRPRPPGGRDRADGAAGEHPAAAAAVTRVGRGRSLVRGRAHAAVGAHGHRAVAAAAVRDTLRPRYPSVRAGRSAGRRAHVVGAYGPRRRHRAGGGDRHRRADHPRLLTQSSPHGEATATRTRRLGVSVAEYTPHMRSLPRSWRITSIPPSPSMSTTATRSTAPRAATR